MNQNSTPKTVLLADDDASILTVLTRAVKNRGYAVRASENLSDIDAWVKEGLGDVIVTDVTMPRANGLDGLKRWRAARPDLPVIVMSAHNTLLNAAHAQDLGAVQFLPKPFDLDTLLALLDQATSTGLPPQVKSAEDGIVRISDELTLIGKSKSMQEVFRTLASLISNDLTVLLTGESGTGKELIARALHALSKRKAAPFIALNMAAIPRELIESALFGHEKGAFTGAHQKQDGAFIQANGGTLFLDEIGDMPMSAQTRLLRVLQEQEITPIGATSPVRTNVRIVAATHRDLSALVANGTFRDDLYFRLHVVPLNVPRLRERTEDIAPLVAHFMGVSAQRGLRTKQLTPEAMALLMRHGWPGNVRELENLIYRLCAVVPSPVISPQELSALLTPQPIALAETAPAPKTETGEIIPQSIESFLQTQFGNYFAAHQGALPAAGLYDRVLARFEKPLIVQTLRATGGNQLRAAEILGINRNTLRKKMRALAIDSRQMHSDAA